MKNLLRSIFILSFIALLNACEKDEGLLPNISFKNGNDYISGDVSKPAESDITIGIEASKSEKEDVLKKFNISLSVDGGTPTSVFDKDLVGNEGDSYSYDYTTRLGATIGQTNEYTFTVTNRDGLINQVSLTVTIE